MKKILLLCLLLLCVGSLLAEQPLSNTHILDEEIAYGSMYQWRSHAAFGKIDEVVVLGNKVFGLSCNSLFAVNKNDGEIEYYSKLNGLNSSVIDHIAYNEFLDRMLITYRNGQIDIMTADGKVYNISDLFLKQMSVSKQVNDISMYRDKAILAMDFGILVVDMKKAEFSETYYIGNNSTEVEVKFVTLSDKKIYAATDQWIYCAQLTDNLMDYASWQTMSYPSGAISGLRAYHDTLYVLVNKKLYFMESNGWKPTGISPSTSAQFRSLCMTPNGLYVLPYNRDGVWRVEADVVSMYLTYGYVYAIVEDGDTYWLGSSDNGLIHLDMEETPGSQDNIQEYYPDGPINNFAYRLRFFGDKLYMLPGGRWANEMRRPGEVMIYENGWWKNIKNSELVKKANGHVINDVMNVAQDPNDDTHYFLTTFGNGLLEMQDTNFVNLYLPNNSNLSSAAPNAPDTYTRTDGAMYDDKGNLWVLNAGGGEGNVHIITPNGMWHTFDLYANGARVELHTPGEIIVDNRNLEWKWIPVLRYNTGLVLLHDKGTPTAPHDDHVTYRTNWVDQNSNAIIPSSIHAIAQDKNNNIWVGTSSGIFVIPYYVDFTESNQCKRVIIPRNDGTMLGDYLLDNEQINAITIDGANRMWIGTASSGVFLLSPIGDIASVEFTVETVAHFTTENSIIPTDEILSIAIQESTGEVFIGTSGGLVSYMSDALEPEETFDNLYAYPNPVYPNYEGYITIKGIMDNTEVRILDAGGNLVAILEGTGGIAVWDGKNVNGDRVASGVYTAMCNTKSGKGHGVVKILMLN